MSIVELCGAARASNRAIEQTSNRSQWRHSFVVADNTFWIYPATSEELIQMLRRSAGSRSRALSRFPRSSIRLAQTTDRPSQGDYNEKTTDRAL
jgi:hypothetical protein